MRYRNIIYNQKDLARRMAHGMAVRVRGTKDKQAPGGSYLILAQDPQHAALQRQNTKTHTDINTNVHTNITDALLIASNKMCGKLNPGC